MQLEVVVLVLLDLLYQALVVLLKSVYQLYDLGAWILFVLVVVYLALELVILVTEDPHVVLEKVDVLSHALHLLLVLLDLSLVVHTLSLELPFEGLVLFNWLGRDPV